MIPQKTSKQRVAERLPEEAAKRFDSWTFSSFDKQLLDRFRLALPEAWRPPSNYSIDFYEITEDTAKSIIEVAAERLGVSAEEHFGIVRKRWFNDQFLCRLPIDTFDWQQGPLEKKLALSAWTRYLKGNHAKLSFPMISRLAELILRTNPKIVGLLRATYSHVFLDEFQDTTNLQYDLLETAFQGSRSVLTAVGDPKQCIMTFAGALAGVTRQYADDYEATPYPLRSNFRSEPELIHIIGSLAKQIDHDAVTPIHGLGKEKGIGECRGFAFANDASEAGALADGFGEGCY